MVAFYITFMEIDIGETFAVEFAYIYYIKALAKNESFGTLVTGGPRDNIGNYNDKFFFYPSDCSGDFRIASEWSFECSVFLFLFLSSILTIHLFPTDQHPRLELIEDPELRVADFNYLLKISAVLGCWWPALISKNTVSFLAEPAFPRTLGGQTLL